MKQEAHYLNTDLDLVAPVDLSPLGLALNALGLLSLHLGQNDNDEWCATFETQEVFRSPDANIAAFLTAIESLDPESRKTWSECTVREFDIGYDSGDLQPALHHQLATQTLARIATLGATVQITLYPLTGD